MIKFIKAILLSILLTIGIQANDLLSKATNGVINNNSNGVKELNVADMKNVLGGYAFYRFPNYDHYGAPAVRSYAFVVLDNEINQDAGAVADEFNLGANEVMVAKARYDYGRQQFNSYLQIYNMVTNQKVREVILNNKTGKVLDEFKIKILGQ